MTERPILFSGWEVRAILAGTKTQTRRMVNPPPILGEYDDIRVCDGGFEIVRYAMATTAVGRELRETVEPLRCLFGVPGDRLFVKETFELRREFDNLSPAAVGKRHGSDVLYLADQGINPSGCHGHFEWGRTRSSIHMPRWASRITLEVTDVRVQRVQDISEEDAMAEGCAGDESGLTDHGVKNEFAVLWNNIHGPGAWERNDWVFVATFRRVQP